MEEELREGRATGSESEKEAEAAAGERDGRERKSERRSYCPKCQSYMARRNLHRIM